MVQSTSQQRINFAPACKDNGNVFKPAWDALDAGLKKWKYGPHSGTGFYNCRLITGGDDYSLHAYPDFTAKVFWNGYRVGSLALAGDINPQQNPYGPRLITDMPRGMIEDIYKIRTNSGAQVFRWGGYYTNNKDAMHFEIVCTKADLASGIRFSTIPRAATSAPAQKPEEDEEEMKTVWIYFKDTRNPAANYRRYADVAEKPLVSGVHLYACTAGQGVYQGAESLAIAQYLSGGTIKPIGSPTKPVGCITAEGKADGWFIGVHLVDGPLAGIKK